MGRDPMEPATIGIVVGLSGEHDFAEKNCKPDRVSQCTEHKALPHLWLKPVSQSNFTQIIMPTKKNIVISLFSVGLK